MIDLASAYLSCHPFPQLLPSHPQPLASTLVYAQVSHTSMPLYLLFPPPGMRFPLKTSKDFHPYFSSQATCSCSGIPSFPDSSLGRPRSPHFVSNGPTYPTPLGSLHCSTSTLLCHCLSSWLLLPTSLCAPQGHRWQSLCPKVGHRTWHTAGTWDL